MNGLSWNFQQILDIIQETNGNSLGFTIWIQGFYFYLFFFFRGGGGSECAPVNKENIHSNVFSWNILERSWSTLAKLISLSSKFACGGLRSRNASCCMLQSGSHVRILEAIMFIVNLYGLFIRSYVAYISRYTWVNIWSDGLENIMP